MRVQSTIAPPDGSAPPAETTTDPDTWVRPQWDTVFTSRGDVHCLLARASVEGGNRDPINDVDDARPPRRWAQGSYWHNTNPGELRVWQCRGSNANFNSDWVYLGADYPNAGTDPPAPAFPGVPLPLHQLVQVAPRPAIDFGALRLRMRRDLGVTKADTLLDSILEVRTLVRAHGARYPILMPSGALVWVQVPGLNLDGTLGRRPAQTEAAAETMEPTPARTAVSVPHVAPPTEQERATVLAASARARAGKARHDDAVRAREVAQRNLAEFWRSMGRKPPQPGG
jgi:hypothetical protein